MFFKREDYLSERSEWQSLQWFGFVADTCFPGWFGGKGVMGDPALVCVLADENCVEQNLFWAMNTFGKSSAGSIRGFLGTHTPNPVLGARKKGPVVSHF